MNRGLELNFRSIASALAPLASSLLSSTKATFIKRISAEQSLFLLSLVLLISISSGDLAADSRLKKQTQLVGSRYGVALLRDLKQPSLYSEGLTYSRSFPIPDLEPVKLSLNSRGEIFLSELPAFRTAFGESLAGVADGEDFVFYTIDPELQRFSQSLLQKVRAPHAALVVMDTRSGKILALASKSNSVKNLVLHSGFPAASIFKVVTAAAALERSALEPYSTIKFRGGDYTLDKWNFRPDSKRDRRKMSVAEALAKSCNPVFGRIALQYLNAGVLRRYAKAFGFNTDLKFDLPLAESSAQVPESDYELSRTAAGFGAVTLNPIHAAVLISGVANLGMLPRPHIVDRVVGQSGEVLYRAKPEYLQRSVSPESSRSLLNMLELTTTIGTSKSEFTFRNRPLLPNVSVAAKTGTLRGKNPPGLNRWFVAAAPSEHPEVAVAVIVVNPSNSASRPSRLGRLLIEKYLDS